MRELGRALLIFIVLSVGTGIVYPFAITGLSQAVFPEKANGSLIAVGDRVVGSKLIGQSFTGPRYFHGRPSAIEKPYDAGNSGGSNFGPGNRKYLEQVEGRVKLVRGENGVRPDTPVPADLVLASGSGLDPHISIEAAFVQAPRVARQRGLPEEEVRRMIAGMAEGRYSGQARVNVLELNLTLDKGRAK
jgi:potassium-transporting ATPase KdpC subunit